MQIVSVKLVEYPPPLPPPLGVMSNCVYDKKIFVTICCLSRYYLLLFYNLFCRKVQLLSGH